MVGFGFMDVSVRLCGINFFGMGFVVYGFGYIYLLFVVFFFCGLFCGFCGGCFVLMFVIGESIMMSSFDDFDFYLNKIGLVYD